MQGVQEGQRAAVVSEYGVQEGQRAAVVSEYGVQEGQRAAVVSECGVQERHHMHMNTRRAQASLPAKNLQCTMRVGMGAGASKIQYSIQCNTRNGYLGFVLNRRREHGRGY